MKKVFSFLLAGLASLSLSSCLLSGDSVSGSGRITTENRNLSGFTKIDVEKGMSVTLEQSDSFEVIVEADDNVQPLVLTHVENGTLYISSEANSFSNVTMNVRVKLPAIKEIEADSGTTVETRNTLLTDYFKIDLSGGCTAEIEIESDKIEAETSSGSTLKMRGKALAADFTTGGGSSIDAENLIANEINASSSSGSSISVHPAVSLNAKASSGSSVEYRGTPKTVTVSESSGGSINKN